MTLHEMVEKIAEQKGISKKAAREEVDSFLNLIFNEGLYKDGFVKLGTYGSFKIRSRAARVARNPKDPSQEIQVPAKYVIAFSSSSETDKELAEIKATGKFDK